MQYTMYYEDREEISSEQYGQMKQMLLQREQKEKAETFMLRKLRFSAKEPNRTIPQYDLCVKTGEKEQIYLEKKYIQNHVWHRACAAMCREDCEKILRGDIQWMKGHREVLFADFYLQATLNHLSPEKVIEYQCETLKCKEGYVIFNKKVRCILGGKYRLFGEAAAIECLEENRVLTIYRKKTTLPNMIREMMQAREQETEETVFAF